MAAASSSAADDKFDPPLGSAGTEPFTTSIPMLVGAAERWNKGGGTNGLLRIMRSSGNSKALGVLVKTTMWMLGAPTIAILLAYYVLLDLIFDFPTRGDKMMAAGIVGMGAVQCVIIGFLIHAFNEPGDDEEKPAAGGGKKDE